jgi:4-amino-4-deoxy-L-arabinose transferase-like glycosyltransferase
MEDMSPGVMVNAEPAPPREVPPRLSEPAVTSWDGIAERWLDEHLNLIALAVIAAAFVARVIVATRSYLNPDEALHYLIINQNSAFFAYKISLTNAHPPLIYLLVYYWRFLGRSELMLRFPSVLAGTALCWFAYKWIGTVFGKAASAIGLILIAFSPALIALSAELRAYALLLFCETTALYLVEIAFKEKSVRKMWYFSIFLYLAILSHYSALFFVLAVGVYALVRIIESEIPRKVIVAWAGGQAGALAVYGFLYVTHVSKLKHLMMTWAMMFDQGYSHSGRQNLFTFSRERTMDIFSFLFENQRIAQALLVLWIAAASLLLFKAFISRRDALRARHASIILLLPFLAVWGAGVAGVYPYVGSRHTVFLAPFLIAALSFLLATLDGQKIWAAVVIAALLVGASNTSAKVGETYISKENQGRKLMTAAVNHIHQTIPPGGEIFTDYESALMLVYYLCGPKLVLPVGTFNLPASRVKCNGYTIGSFQTWNLEAAVFLSDFKKMVQAQRLKSGDKIWVFQAGWAVDLDRQLASTSLKFRCLTPKTFGANITVTPFVVDQDLSPAATVTDCSQPILNPAIN